MILQRHLLTIQKFIFFQQLTRNGFRFSFLILDFSLIFCQIPGANILNLHLRKGLQTLRNNGLEVTISKASHKINLKWILIYWTKVINKFIRFCSTWEAVLIKKYGSLEALSSNFNKRIMSCVVILFDKFGSLIHITKIIKCLSGLEKEIMHLLFN